MDETPDPRPLPFPHVDPYTHNAPAPIPLPVPDGLGVEQPDDEPCCDDGDADPFAGLESREARFGNEVTAELNANQAALDELIEGLIKDVTDTLDESAAALNSLQDELIGAADLVLSETGTQWNKFINKFTSDTARTLMQNEGELLNANFQIPYSWVDQANALAGDWVQMLASAVPVMGPYLGVDATPPDVPAYNFQQVADGTVGATVPDLGPVPLNLPSVPVSDVPTSWNLPAVVELPPTPPTPTPPTRVTANCDDRNINVTVVVPPIVVPGLPTCGKPSTLLNPISPPPFNIQGGGGGAGGGGGMPPIVEEDKEYPPPINNPKPGTVGPGLTGGPPANIQGADPEFRQQSYQNVPDTTVPPIPVVTMPGQASSLLAPDATSISYVKGNAGIYWNDLSSCELAGKLAANVAGAERPQEQKEGARALDEAIKNLLPFGTGAYDWTTRKGRELWGPDAYNWFADRWDKNIGWGAESLVGIGAATVARISAEQLSPTSTPNPKAAIYYASRLGVARAAESKLHIPMSYLYTSDEYMLKFSNPQELPNQIRTDQAFLDGQIDENLWVCWTRANGNLPEPARRVMLADQARPNLSELITLYRRGVIDEQGLAVRARSERVLQPAYIKEWLEASKALPTQSDLIRFMVRDAADDAVAAKYGYDTDFDQKYTAQMKAWAKALGLDDQYFKMSWRSHWEIPSWTQLTEMLARLRPDRPQVTEWDDKTRGMTPREAIAQNGSRPLVVTEADVKEALEINDLAPGWVQKQIEVSYTPINRTDSVRAYMIGAFNEERLYHAFRDVRYSERDARTLVEFYKQDKARRVRNISGVWSIKKIVRYYKAAVISRDTAAELLQPLQPNRAGVDEILNAADLELQADIRATNIKGLRRGFMVGEYSEPEVYGSLKLWQLDDAQAARLAKLWTVERDTRFKMPTVAQIAAWVKAKLIGVEQARIRLKNFGYKQEDADRIILKALAWDFDDEVPTPDELSDAITTAVKNQKEAREKSDTWLGRMAQTAEATLRRVRAEQKRRLTPDERTKWNPLTIP